MRGRAAQPPETRVGLFIRDHLARVGEATIQELHRAYKERLGYFDREITFGYVEPPFMTVRKPKRPPHRYRAATYLSFQRYIHLFKQLGFIEFTGRVEAPTLPQLADKKYYRLTAEGMAAPETSWLTPWRLVRPPVPPVSVEPIFSEVADLAEAWRRRIRLIFERPAEEWGELLREAASDFSRYIADVIVAIDRIRPRIVIVGDIERVEVLRSRLVGIRGELDAFSRAVRAWEIEVLPARKRLLWSGIEARIRLIADLLDEAARG